MRENRKSGFVRGGRQVFHEIQILKGVFSLPTRRSKMHDNDEFYEFMVIFEDDMFGKPDSRKKKNRATGCGCLTVTTFIIIIISVLFVLFE